MQCLCSNWCLIKASTKRTKENDDQSKVCNPHTCSSRPSALGDHLVAERETYDRFLDGLQLLGQHTASFCYHRAPCHTSICRRHRDLRRPCDLGGGLADRREQSIRRLPAWHTILYSALTQICHRRRLVWRWGKASKRALSHWMGGIPLAGYLCRWQYAQC